MFTPRVYKWTLTFLTLPTILLYVYYISMINIRIYISMIIHIYKRKVRVVRKVRVDNIGGMLW